MAMRPTRLPDTKVLEREREALNLRRARLPFDQIAEQLGYKTESGARAAVKRALGRVSQGSVEEYRREEADMLNRLHRAYWVGALSGDEKAARIVLSICERRAKLLGLDAPVRVDAKITDALDAQIEELVAELAAVAQLEARASGPDTGDGDG